MSDLSGLFGEPEAVNPEILTEFFAGNIVPLTEHLFDGDFLDSVPGNQVSLKIIKGPLKIYFSAECLIDEQMDEDGEPTGEMRVFREVHIYIGVLLADEIEAALKASFSQKLNELSDEDVVDEDIEDDTSGVRGWDYVKFIFDYDEGELLECIRYVSLESPDDEEVFRDNSPKTVRDIETVMSDEYSLVETCTDLHLRRLYLTK